MARLALVTGGSRGSGRAISDALKKAGHRVVATYSGNDAAAKEFTASLVATVDPKAGDAKVFFTAEDGRTFVVRASEEFELLGVNNLGEKCLATPAIADGRWYFRTEKQLFCIGYPK